MSKINNFRFNDLFVFDLANNHQGDFNHGKKIIKSLSNVSKSNKIYAGIKFQFRNLANFIHKDFKDDENHKHIKRFQSTELGWDDFFKLKIFAKQNELMTICTPFDETSVEKVVEMDFDILKIASCSADDWPLLEKAALTGLPMIVSTGGLNINQIDNLVSFFEHKGVTFSLMHCVSIYPMNEENAQLSFILKLKNRYPNTTIGWSTHENPDNYSIIKMAYSCGARMYERHVGIENDIYTLNKYSSTPKQIDMWIKEQIRSKKIFGEGEKQIQNSEIQDLISLKRGVYLKRNIKKGNKITIDDVYFSIPRQENGMHSGMWKENLTLKLDKKKDEFIKVNEISYDDKFNKNQILKKSIHIAKGILNEAKVFLNSDFEAEFSHHYGVEEFEKTGAIIINCINREYCKKLVIVLPGQSHPDHYHKRKEETFNLLYGDFELTVDGAQRSLYPGDISLVMPGVWHSFKSKKGCIVEEVSTTHFKNDSVYKDPFINKLSLEQRKTKVPNWGRYFI